MSTHYFDLHEPITGLTRDYEGCDFASDDAVRNYALRAARAMLAEEILRGTIGLDCEIIVRDETDEVCFVLRFRDAVVLN